MLCHLLQLSCPSFTNDILVLTEPLISFLFASSEINCGPWKYFNVAFDYENVEMFETEDFCPPK